VRVYFNITLSSVHLPSFVNINQQTSV